MPRVRKLPHERAPRRKVSQLSNAKVILQREREAEMLQMRKQGLTYAEIGKRMNRDHSTVRQAIKSAIRELTREDAEEVRDIELARLDEMLAAWWPRAIGSDGEELDEKAAGIVLKLMQQRSAYLGLDAPKRIEAAGLLTIETLAGMVGPYPPGIEDGSVIDLEPEPEPEGDAL